MSKRVPLCAICLLGVIAVVSFAFVYLILHHHKPCKNGECVVKIDLGHLRGRERETITSKKIFYSFKGIPYAKAPLGSLRFKDPEPYQHWHTVIDATKDGNECLQPSWKGSHLEPTGSEDCLFLNVYTTQFPDHDVTYHPVLVYFHGGGFTYGSSLEKRGGADYLVEYDVVVVTVNYRLGAFGFLSLDNDDIPGNFGLKDQQLALKWVQQHISHFGGDPKSVTIFGHSAGSASVQYHMLSPSSKGLFHNAAMFSGSVLNPWAFEANPVQKAFRFGKLLGLSTENKKDLANFLRNKSASDIINVQKLHFMLPEEEKTCLPFPFTPSVENHGGQNGFLTEHPKVLLETNKFFQVPTFVGATKREGLIALLRNNFVKNFDDDLTRFVPPDAKVAKNSPQYQNVLESIKEFYFHNQSPSLERLEDFIDICGDLGFMYGLQKSIDYFVKNSTVPVYVEKFTFNGKFSFLEKNIKSRWPSLKIASGPGHSDDGAYILYSYKTDNVSDASNDIDVVKQFTWLLTSFATFQKPSQNDGVEWKATSINNPILYEIDQLVTELPEPLLAREKVEFWDDIYNLISQPMK